MPDPTTRRPATKPSRPRPARRRKRDTAAPAPHRVARSQAASAPDVTIPTIEREPQTMGGGGSSGRGPIDDDGGGGRRPDRGGDGDRTPLLIALGILAVGAGVIGARLAARAGRGRRSALLH